MQHNIHCLASRGFGGVGWLPMPDNGDNANPPAPWRRRSPAAVGGEDSRITHVWSWRDEDENVDRFVAIDGDMLVLGAPLEPEGRQDLVQEAISLDALEGFLREAGWSVGRP